MKIKSYLLLFALALILIFVIGVRYGQKVEKTNKIINYLLSITPTKPPTSIPTKPWEYKTYMNKNCGISFLYPSYLEVTDASKSAVFSENKMEQIEIGCDENDRLKETIADEDIATAEAIFKNRKIIVKNTNNNSVYIFQISNPRNLKTIYIAIYKSLYPLFERSVDFLTY